MVYLEDIVGLGSDDVGSAGGGGRWQSPIKDNVPNEADVWCRSANKQWSKAKSTKDHKVPRVNVRCKRNIISS